MRYSRLPSCMVFLAAILCALFAQSTGGLAQTNAPGSIGTARAEMAALLRAGGGASNFSLRDALASVIGDAKADRELDQLGAKYGVYVVAQWENIAVYTIGDAVAVAAAEGVTLPAPPSHLQGKALARALVRLGIARNGRFDIATMGQRLVPQRVNEAVINDISNRFDMTDAPQFRRITDQVMVDLAKEVGLRVSM
jgi:hypothetical protein